MRKLTLSLAVIVALLPGRGYPLGLGEIELKSALNQELDAEVQVLSAELEDAEQLIIKLASREAFARAGIDRPFLLTQLKFKIIVKNDKPYVKIYTQNPIKEPFLSFLLDVDWPDGHLLREYTLLLDPPIFSGMTSPTRRENGGRPFIDPADQTQYQNQSGARSQTSYGGRPASMDGGRPAQYEVAAPQATDIYVDSDSRPAASDRPMMAESRAQARPAPVVTESNAGQRRVTYQPMPQYSQVSGDYRVQANDTLWSIANRYRSGDVTVEQMMLALVRENPEAFIKENINGVKRGYILRMPNRQQLARIDRQQALAQVKQHTALWREYRQALTGSRPASALESRQTASADSMKKDTTDGKLTIVSASDDFGSETASTSQEPNAELRRLQNQLAMAREALESERLEKEGLRTRLADLEQRVESVLEMDDSELARLQQDLKGVREQADAPVPVIDTMEPLSIDEPAVEVEQPVVEEVIELPAPAELTEQEMAAVPDQEIIEEAPVFIDETMPAEEVAPPVTMPAPVAPSADAPAFVKSKSKSYIQSLLDDPKMLATAGALLSAIVLLIAMIMRRRRVNKDETEWVDLGQDATSMDNFDAEAEFGSAAVDEGDFMENAGATTEMKSASFDETQVDQSLAGSSDTALDDTVMGLDDNQPQSDEDKDDVISEADVYMAYGIYQQAEDLLKDAIAKNPDRDDYRLKLLETHYAAKNSDEFVALAEEVQQRKGSDKSYWDRVVAMGKELSPAHALFSGAAASVAADDLLPKRPESTDLDLGDDADLELGLDDLTADETADEDKTMIMDQPLDLDDTELALDDDLDLDAGLDSFAEDTASAADETAAAEDMEFDLGDFDADMLSDADAGEAEVSADEMDIDDSFSLDFEASDLGFDKEGEAATADDSSLDADLDLAMDFDGGAAEAASDEGDMSLDLDDFSMDLESESATTSAADDGGLALDLDSSDVTDMGEDDFDISELSEDVDEVSTKLELARAYIDMGDKAGAKSILEEVKEEGNGDQQSRADELLKEAS